MSLTNGSGGVSRIGSTLPDLDALGRHALVVHRRLRDLLHDLDAVRHVAEDRVFAVEARLIDDGDEELLAGAVGFARESCTAATDPRVIFAARGSSFTAFSPPVPHCARFDGSFVSGSPPCTIPYLIILWKIVPL
mgnify:CR=1 FL=1